ncbi:geranylgeranylglyceryl/heptaprenylglyceryl phosphate synthase [Mangrovivirga sp. M17]|uniref:Geranylgeranylglyceryl phosphate synthase n=1 Tax=Mangrovivirga halotolerans TaxID=2993936 RepID=A0ABT3RUM9_9BACT|nr:geranylgeranylglyceryl/heptaprenylglyceryl phosphate synthase [Mangrovivirga halotolerans]MCX2744850.1 geranylgeranylglyceryl/heptaprenylglyceryl phosphate synthase [Mangrovivirga halotolerans]
MNNRELYKDLTEKTKKGTKSFAVLIDPDKIDSSVRLNKLIMMAVENKVDYFFIGGSLMMHQNLSWVVSAIKEGSNIPVILFPGNNLQLDPHADGLLLLSLISGRNPELLIGQHVLVAPVLKKSKIEIISTGYMLIHSGKPTAAGYMSHSQPIPSDKPDIAASTAMAGELLGQKVIYMDGGSGAEKPIPPRMIKMVKKSIEIPLIVGGGITNKEKALQCIESGADVVVVGNGIEKNPGLMTEVANIVERYNQSLNVHN